MSLVIYISTIPLWLGRMFNPPPLASMTTSQKVGRVILISVSLVTLCVVLAMLLAAGIFLVQRMPDLLTTLFAGDYSVATKIAGILLLSVTVNTLCVFILLQVRRLDRGLMSEPGESESFPEKAAPNKFPI